MIPILMALASAAASPAAARASANQCVPMTTELKLEAETAARQTAEAFAAALESQSLGLLRPQLLMQLGDFPRADAYCSLLDPTWDGSKPCPAVTPAVREDGSFAPWQTETYQVDGVTKWFVGSNVYAGPLNRSVRLDAAVFDPNGAVYRLNRQPNVVASKSYYICGCGPVGGGVPPPYVVEQNLFELPRADAFNGDLTLTYDVSTVEFTYNNLLPNGEMCPQPP